MKEFYWEKNHVENHNKYFWRNSFKKSMEKFLKDFLILEEFPGNFMRNYKSLYGGVRNRKIHWRNLFSNFWKKSFKLFCINPLRSFYMSHWKFFLGGILMMEFFFISECACERFSVRASGGISYETHGAILESIQEIFLQFLKEFWVTDFL